MRAYRFSPPETVVAAAGHPEPVAANAPREIVPQSAALLAGSWGACQMAAAAGNPGVGPALLLATTGFGLMLGAAGIWGGRRWAWLVSAGLLAVLAVYRLLEGGLAPAGGSLLGAVLLALAGRTLARLRPEPHRGAKALHRAVFAAAVTAAYAMSGMVLLGFDWAESVARVMRLLLSTGSRAPVFLTPRTLPFEVTVLAVGYLALLYVAVALWPVLAVELDLRPAAPLWFGFRGGRRANPSPDGPVRSWGGVSSCAGLHPAGSARLDQGRRSGSGGFIV